MKRLNLDNTQIKTNNFVWSLFNNITNEKISLIWKDGLVSIKNGYIIEKINLLYHSIDCYRSVDIVLLYIYEDFAHIYLVTYTHNFIICLNSSHPPVLSSSLVHFPLWFYILSSHLMTQFISLITFYLISHWLIFYHISLVRFYYTVEAIRKCSEAPVVEVQWILPCLTRRIQTRIWYACWVVIRICSFHMIDLSNLWSCFTGIRAITQGNMEQIWGLSQTKNRPHISIGIPIVKIRRSHGQSRRGQTTTKHNIT